MRPASTSLDWLLRRGAPPSPQVIRDFHRAAGMTPGQYLRDRRIRAASTLIKTDMPLAEIAAATGFADQSHLTRVFKTIKGLSPGAWRAAT
nr:helix-turn-helix transcriptional regulator [Mesorhizobium silamurunense]